MGRAKVSSKCQSQIVTATQIINGQVRCPKCNGKFWLVGSGAVCTECEHRIKVDREEMESLPSSKSDILEMVVVALNALDDVQGTDVTCTHIDMSDVLHIRMNDGSSFELTINQTGKTVQWNKARYNQLLQEIQDTLDEDEDCLRDIARDLLCGEEGLEKYIREELEDNNPIKRLVNGLA